MFTLTPSPPSPNVCRGFLVLARPTNTSHPSISLARCLLAGTLRQRLGSGDIAIALRAVLAMSHDR